MKKGGREPGLLGLSLPEPTRYLQGHWGGSREPLCLVGGRGRCALGHCVTDKQPGSFIECPAWSRQLSGVSLKHFEPLYQTCTLSVLLCFSAGWLGWFFFVSAKGALALGLIFFMVLLG